jgi:hypothetical protein
MVFQYFIDTAKFRNQLHTTDPHTILNASRIQASILAKESPDMPGQSERNTTITFI